MKFENRPLLDNVNVAKRNPLKDFLDLALKVLGSLVFVYLILGLIVDSMVVHISPDLEAKLAQILTSQFKQTAPTDVEKYLTTIANDMAKLSPELKDRKFKVFVKDEKDPNAYAWPGNNIVVTSKLLDVLKNENEIAMILGHELGHFAQRDHLRGLGRGLVLLTISAIVLGVDSRINNSISSIFSNSELNHSREQEASADVFGLNLLARKYGHVGGSEAFFEYIKNAYKIPAWLEFFSDHPSTEWRIQNIKKISLKNHWEIGSTKEFLKD